MKKEVKPLQLIKIDKSKKSQEKPKKQSKVTACLYVTLDDRLNPSDEMIPNRPITHIKPSVQPMVLDWLKKKDSCANDLLPSVQVSKPFLFGFIPMGRKSVACKLVSKRVTVEDKGCIKVSFTWLVDAPEVSEDAVRESIRERLYAEWGENVVECQRIGPCVKFDDDSDKWVTAAKCSVAENGRYAVLFTQWGSEITV
jgi:hypothetical protein